jgi:hypothetical protein
MRAHPLANLPAAGPAQARRIVQNFAATPSSHGTVSIVDTGGAESSGNVVVNVRAAGFVAERPGCSCSRRRQFVDRGESVDSCTDRDRDLPVDLGITSGQQPVSRKQVVEAGWSLEVHERAVAAGEALLSHLRCRQTRVMRDQLHECSREGRARRVAYRDSSDRQRGRDVRAEDDSIVLGEGKRVGTHLGVERGLSSEIWGSTLDRQDAEVGVRIGSGSAGTRSGYAAEREALRLQARAATTGAKTRDDIHERTFEVGRDYCSGRGSTVAH